MRVGETAAVVGLEVQARVGGIAARVVRRALAEIGEGASDAGDVELRVDGFATQVAEQVAFGAAVGGHQQGGVGLVGEVERGDTHVRAVGGSE